MVDFKLVYQDENILKYEYYPEGKFDKQPGIITVKLKSKNLLKDIKVIKKAEKDFRITHTVKEQNDFREALNNACKENGEPELAEDKYPIATEDISYLCYGYKAAIKIYKAINNGEIPKKGTVMWY